MKEVPKIRFDARFQQEIPRLAHIQAGSPELAREREGMFILFFGEKNKLLVYDILGDKWSLLTMENSLEPYHQELEFNYFG